MTRGSIWEYAEAVRGRYFLVSEKEKGKILDEFTNVTGRHQKPVIISGRITEDIRVRLYLINLKRTGGISWESLMKRKGLPKWEANTDVF